MITVRDIMDLMEQKAPFDTAEEWDNSGLLVGDPQKTVTSVLVTLDITEDAIVAAQQQGAELIVSHHPVIFEPLSHLSAQSLPYRLVRAGVAALCAHTNLDKACGGVNDTLASQLGLIEVSVAPDGMSRIGKLPVPMTGEVFARTVSKTLGTAVRVKIGEDKVGTVALCGGAGASLTVPLLTTADALVTGEVKHHEWLAVPKEKTAVDAGHYYTEVTVTDTVGDWLKHAFPSLKVTVYRAAAPYQVIKD